MTKTKMPNEMSFLDHIEDLRWHLIRITVAIMVCAVIAFVFKSFLFDVILFGPKDMSFPTYKFLCNLSESLNIKDVSFCADKFPFEIQSRFVAGQFSAHLWTSFYAGFILAFPYVLYQIWSFIKPALHENERKYSKGFIIVCSLLFFIGVLFGYYILTPFSINFFGTYSVSSQVHNDFDLASYIAIVRASVLASGTTFELPVIIYFLTKVGLVTPKFLKTYRKHALVVILIVSAIITPPDIISQVIVSIPVLFLYQISIYISKLVVKKQTATV